MQEQSAILSNLINSVMDAIVSTDESQNIIMFNHAAELMFGHRAADIIGQPLDKLIPARFRAMHRQHVENFGRTGATTRTMNAPGVSYGLRANGEEFIFEASISKAEVAGEKTYTAILRDITERKEAEKALWEAKEKFQSLVESSSDWIWEVDANAVYTYASPKVKDLLGYEPREVIGRTPFDLMPPEEKVRVGKLFEEIAREKKPFSGIENSNLHKDGHLVILETSGVPVFDNEGGLCGYRGIDRDITERKLVEQAFLESEAKSHAIIEATPVPLSLNDAQGNITYLNQAFVQTIGYTMDDIPTLADWWPRAYPDPQYRQWVVETWQNNLDEAKRTNGDFSPIELNIRCKDGPVRTFIGGATPLQERFAGTHLVTLYDITEHKQAEVELRIASTAFESQESMVITDADGVILRVNQAFTEATGYTAEEAVGQTPRLLKSGRQDADFYREMWGTLLRTGKWQGEIWDRRKNGEIYPKLLSISAVKGDDGVVTHYVGVDHDITKRKAAEEEINNLAFYDSLTQLPNRRLLNDRLGKIMAASKRSGRYGALMFLDLDNFKPLNDEHGHSVGDSLLVEAARRIARCVREVDTVARFGGDEFVVVLSELDEDKAESTAQASIVAEKIRTTLAEPYLLKIQSEGKAETTVEHHCTSSIGVVLFTDHEASEEDILKWADMAMYQAKEAGRNQIRFYEPEA
ncbi:MAG: PAS domain S-box protein [Thiobacillus sp.]|nr:PAS domain S-box protein [Thiobacillus sp.]